MRHIWYLILDLKIVNVGGWIPMVLHNYTLTTISLVFQIPPRAHSSAGVTETAVE